MGTEKYYDAIIIGTGQAGKPLAHALAEAGRQTAIIERRHVGGSCVNYGCTPTKTMVASARIAHLARRAADYGVETGPVSIDLGTVRQRKRSMVASFRDGGRAGLEKQENLELLMGDARFVGEERIEVALDEGGTCQLTSETIFINTGTRPAKPAIDGLAGIESLDNESIMELDEIPQHLLIIGGGYIGLEFGQMFRRFGSEVTIVQRGEQLLSCEDADVAEAVADILREDGVEILLAAAVDRVRRQGNVIELVVRMNGRERMVTGTHLLVAAGRQPNTDTLGLENTRVTVDDRGYIEVNERLETREAGIYALGDVNGGPAFTHVAYDDFRIVQTNLLQGGDADTRDRLIPYTVFIDPQLGRAGPTEKAMRAQGRDVRVAKLPMSSVARALETDETRGFMKAVVDAETDRILGAAILGVEGGEVMSVLQVAMMGDMPWTAMRDGIFAHPTLAESLNNLFMKLD